MLVQGLLGCTILKISFFTPLGVHIHHSSHLLLGINSLDKVKRGSGHYVIMVTHGQWRNHSLWEIWDHDLVFTASQHSPSLYHLNTTQSLSLQKNLVKTTHRVVSSDSVRKSGGLEG